MVEDIVIVGAGIAGLATSLGLHRLGIRSLVLESSSSLRVTGFALGTWTNAWKALDALGVANSLRKQTTLIHGSIATSLVSGQSREVMSFLDKGKYGEHELRCVRRKVLLETLEKELPAGTIRYCSKVISIQESDQDDHLKQLHLADGTIIKSKVLIGCDGVNSVVAKWLGFKNAAFTGRFAVRGCAELEGSHGIGSNFHQLFGKGTKSGFIPCDQTSVYWFFAWCPPSTQDLKEMEENPSKLKEFVVSELGNAPNYMRSIVEKTEEDSVTISPLRYRYPWEMVMGNISKGNVCVAGDAQHPMTPDIGQGGCAALEDAVVLARCLGQAFKGSDTTTSTWYHTVEICLSSFAKQRRWRNFDLITTSYLVGRLQQAGGHNLLLKIFTDYKPLFGFLAALMLNKAGFDCGQLVT